MRLHEVLQHARETGCEATRKHGDRLRWTDDRTSVRYWDCDDLQWRRPGPWGFSIDDILATDWQTSDGWQPASATERVEVLEGLLRRTKTDWLSELSLTLEDPDAIEDFNELVSAIDEALGNASAEVK